MLQRDDSQVLGTDTPGFQEMHRYLKGTEKGFTIVIFFLSKCSKEREVRGLWSGVWLKQMVNSFGSLEFSQAGSQGVLGCPSETLLSC